MYFQKIFLIIISINLSLPSLWANNIMQNSNTIDIEKVTSTALHDNQLSPLEQMARIYKVNLMALETFGELNRFWGNSIHFFRPLSERIENGLLLLLRKISPQIFSNLNSSDIAISKVTRAPSNVNSLIKELIQAVLINLKNGTFVASNRKKP